MTIYHINVYIDMSLQVRGKDNVGATMDSMDLERQRGITIQVGLSGELTINHERPQIEVGTPVVVGTPDLKG